MIRRDEEMSFSIYHATFLKIVEIWNVLLFTVRYDKMVSRALFTILLNL